MIESVECEIGADFAEGGDANNLAAQIDEQTDAANFRSLE